MLTKVHYPGNVAVVPLSLSKVTSQGQISVPVEVRNKLGVGPGSSIEWLEEDGKVWVRRSGLFSSEDIHKAAFPLESPEPKTLEQLKDGIRKRMQERYARG